MKKRKLITMLVALCLVAAVGVGATLAYFTDKEEVTNVVTMGKVDISLYETKDGEITSDGLTFKNVVPGQPIEKDPTVAVDKDSNDCFVRVKVEFVGLDESHASQLFNTINNLNVDKTVWTYDEKTGYFYHNEIMKAEDKETLFKGFSIPAIWGNEMATKEFKILLTAEAVQADYVEVTGHYVVNGQDVAVTVKGDTAIKAFNMVTAPGGLGIQSFEKEATGDPQ